MRVVLIALVATLCAGQGGGGGGGGNQPKQGGNSVNSVHSGSASSKCDADAYACKIDAKRHCHKKRHRIGSAASSECISHHFSECKKAHRCSGA